MPEVTQWSRNEAGKWTVVEGSVEPKLHPNLYELEVVTSLFGTFISLKEMHPNTDKLIPLPDSVCGRVVDGIETFWNSKDLYDSMGLLHKRGLLLEGKPGTGKTAICLVVGREIASKGGVAIFTAPNTDLANGLPVILQAIRHSQPETPIVNIMEDIDKHAGGNPYDPYTNKHRASLNSLLALLDGENQVSNIVHIATTNYIRDLDDRLTNRPSRFDEIISVKAPGIKARTAYLKGLLPETHQEKLADLVAAADGLNFAHIKELAISCVIFNRDVKKTSERLQRLASAIDANRGKDLTAKAVVGTASQQGVIPLPQDDDDYED